MSESQNPTPVPPTPAPTPAASVSKPAQAGPATATKPIPAPPRALPPYRVLLHHDSVNEMMYVVQTIVELTPLKVSAAEEVMRTAHTRGLAQVLLTHKERAELYVEQFKSKRLKATMEPVGP